MSRVIQIVICFLLYHAPAQTYKVTVLEHAPDVSDSPENTILKNLNGFRDHIAEAKKQGAEIVVFPEYGLTGLTSDVESYAVDLSNTSHVREALFGMAKEHGVYLVVNILEKVQEVNKATKYHNTNLVFDRNGNIILKYRKINLSGREDKLTPGDASQPLNFTTDFDVTFGTFTGNDILFYNPSRRVLEDPAVTDIVYPTAWYNTLPFFSALSVQHGYALSNGVNLLAAGYDKPSQSLGGSGIYSSGKPIELYIWEKASTKRLVQDVFKKLERTNTTLCLTIRPQGLPEDVGGNNVTNFNVTKDFRSESYKYQTVDLTTKDSSYQVCQGDFCCNFNITVDTSSVRPNEHYEMVASDSYTTIDNVRHHLRICSLLACESASIDTCGNKQLNITTKFTKVTVEGNFINEEDTFYVPSTLNVFLQPIVNTYYCNTKPNANSTFIQLTTGGAQDNLLAFGLIGKTISAGSSIQAFGFFFLVGLALIKFVF